MNQHDARVLIRWMILGLQRFRSICLESEDELLLLEELHPWAFGPKCVLPTLSKIEARDVICGSDLYHVVTIFCRFMPEVVLLMSLKGFDFPEQAEMSWYRDMPSDIGHG